MGDTSNAVSAVAVVEPPSKAMVKAGRLGVSGMNLTPDQVITAAIKSGYYKHLRSKEDGFIIAAYGAALGMDLTTALSSIVLVNGRMTLTANYIAALVKKSGRYRYKVESKTDKACTLAFYEKVEHCTKEGKTYWEWELSGTETFSVEMAKRAGLTGKGPNWTSYPEAMCFARAMTAGVRTYCPDLLLGHSVYTPDELDPSIQMTLSSEGDLIPEADCTVKSLPTPTHSEDSASRIPEIESLIASTGSDRTGLLTYFGVKSLTELKPADQDTAVRMLKAKAKAPVKA